MSDVPELRVALTVADFSTGPSRPPAMRRGDTTRVPESQGAPCPLEAGVPFSWLDEAQAENSSNGSNPTARFGTRRLGVSNSVTRHKYSQRPVATRRPSVTKGLTALRCTDYLTVYTLQRMRRLLCLRS